MLDGMWQPFDLRLATNWRLDFGGDADYSIARARRASLLPFDVDETDSDSLSIPRRSSCWIAHDSDPVLLDLSSQLTVHTPSLLHVLQERLRHRTSIHIHRDHPSCRASAVSINSMPKLNDVNICISYINNIRKRRPNEMIMLMTSVSFSLLLFPFFDGGTEEK